jgi:hypothetical protein
MIKIRTFINGWNDRCQPFAWNKTADQILKKANRKTTSVAVHYGPRVADAGRRSLITATVR